MSAYWRTPEKLQQDAVSLLHAHEWERLQGVWIQVACEIDGVKNAVEEYGSEPRVTFKGCEYVVSKADGSVAIRGRFELDPTQTPKTIDWSDTFGADAGVTIPAIYSLNESRFAFCAACESRTRPTEFAGGTGAHYKNTQTPAPLSVKGRAGSDGVWVLAVTADAVRMRPQTLPVQLKR